MDGLDRSEFDRAVVEIPFRSRGDLAFRSIARPHSPVEPDYLTFRRGVAKRAVEEALQGGEVDFVDEGFVNLRGDALLWRPFHVRCAAAAATSQRKRLMHNNKTIVVEVKIVFPSTEVMDGFDRSRDNSVIGYGQTRWWIHVQMIGLFGEELVVPLDVAESCRGGHGV